MSFKHMIKFLITLTSLLSSLSIIVHADPFDHPRLFLSKSDETELKARIKSDPLSQKIYAELIKRTDEIITIPTAKHYIPDGIRLLSESRYALRNILHTAMAWRLTKDKKYLNRAILEMEAACSFQDWNTTHFLDTSEMSTAVAIGYDWLYQALTPEQREHYSTALTKLGLEPAREGFSGEDKAWWTEPRNNWSQICATGLLITERALEKKGEPLHPARIAARDILNECRAFYLPSGGYPEGPSYWHYGSIYHALGIAVTRNDREEMAMQTPPEFEKSALFPIQLTGTSGYVFNFADSGSTAGRSGISAAQSWMVREFKDPSSVKYIRQKLEQFIAYPKNPEQIKNDRFFPLLLIWLPKETQQATQAFPLDSQWQGIQPIATFRGSWTDPNAIYLAIKGGLCNYSHGHMDVGSFVFESDGVRWVEDLGSDEYNLPGYFSPDEERWKIFRLNNFSHNTLVIGGKLQNIEAETSPLTEFESKPSGGHAVIDMTPAYSGQAVKVLRRADFNRDSKTMTLSDTITTPKASVRWAIMTKAKIEINSKNVLLKSENKTLRISRNDLHGGTWKILSAKPLTPEENQNEGYQILSFTAPAADKLELNVTFTPLEN